MEASDNGNFPRRIEVMFVFLPAHEFIIDLLMYGVGRQ
jgi:hypothetical protein